MLKTILKKFFEAVLTIWGLATLLFILFQAIPADPARMMLDQREDEQLLKSIRAKYGFDRPVAVQYALYINDLSPLSLASTDADDFTCPEGRFKYIKVADTGKFDVILKAPYLRQSYQKNGQNVSEIIAATLPNTMLLALVAMAFAMILGVSLGVVVALRKDSALDRFVSVFGAVGMSVPSFFAAIIIAWIFGFILHKYTGLGITGNLYTVDALGRGEYLTLSAIILPAVTLGIRPLAVVIQLTRDSLLDVMNQDYIRTARAKGLSTSRIVIKHALRNAMNPVLTASSGWFAGMLAGSVFIETIFAWNGLGKAIVDGLNTLDLPVVMGAVLVISSVFIIINMLVDIAYRWLDPRIRELQ